MQNAHETVAKGTEGLVMEVAGGAVLVIKRSGARAFCEGGEGPLVDGVIEAAVAYVASQHGAFLARCHGQG